jgi:hypothetical protein
MRSFHRLAVALAMAPAGAAQTGILVEAPQPSRPDQVAFDPVRNVTLFARSLGGSRILEWDGTSVRERLPAPPDATRILWLGVQPTDGRRMLLLNTNNAISFGTWRGTDWQMQSTSPPLTFFGSELFAWDENRQRLVVWQAQLNAYLLEFDGTQWTWMPVTTGPGRRSSPAFAWDPIGQRVLLYGGWDGASHQWTNDCWSWDGTTWRQVAANGPPATQRQPLLGHAPHLGGSMVLYGDGNNDRATWLLIGSTWLQLPTGNDAGFQNNAWLVPDRTGLLLVPAANANRGDVFRLQADWLREPALTASDLRPYGGAAFDHIRGYLLLHGGAIEPNKTTQVWDGRWHDLAPAHSPSPRGGPLLAWSAVDGRVLLFGGLSNSGPQLNDTWTWTGSDWSALVPPTVPPPRLGPVLVEDPSGGVLLFGGASTAGVLNDHWLWSGGTWTQLQPSPVPSPRYNVAAALDPVRNRVVLIGPTAGGHDTWEWDGANWSLQQAVHPVNLSVSPPMGFDPQRGRVVLYQSGLQEWNGANWIPLTTTTAPVYLPFAFVTDTREARLLALDHGPDPGVWRLAQQPATIVRVGTGCALGPGRPPGLSLLDEPRFAQPRVTIEVDAAPAGAPTLLAIGTSRLDVPLGAGCILHVQVPFATLIAAADASGVARTDFRLANNPALRGAQFVTQGLAFDPQRSPIGIGTLTPALVITVGD